MRVLKMAEIDKDKRGYVPEGFVKGSIPLHRGVGACPTVLHALRAWRKAYKAFPTKIGEEVGERP